MKGKNNITNELPNVERNRASKKNKLIEDLKSSPFLSASGALPNSLKTLFGDSKRVSTSASADFTGRKPFDPNSSLTPPWATTSLAQDSSLPVSTSESAFDLKRHATMVLTGNMNMRNNKHLKALSVKAQAKTLMGDINRVEKDQSHLTGIRVGNNSSPTKRSGTAQRSGSPLGSPFKRRGNSSIFKERQGPIDWSIYGLKSKYRGEMERETAYRESVKATESAQQNFDENFRVIPAVILERHPLAILFDALIAKENDAVKSKLKVRLSMKRFVMDLHELWLTNLQHIREHQAANVVDDLGNKITYEQADGTGGEDAGKKVPDLDAGMRGRGLKDRRDVDAILRMSSQIPSVSHKRAMTNAYYTTKFTEPKVVLDYNAEPTADTSEPDILPPHIEHICSAKLASNENIVVTIDRLLTRVCGNSLLFDKNSLYRFGFKERSGVVVRKLFTTRAWWRIRVYDSLSMQEQVYICPEHLLMQDVKTDAKVDTADRIDYVLGAKKMSLLYRRTSDMEPELESIADPIAQKSSVEKPIMTEKVPLKEKLFDEDDVADNSESLAQVEFEANSSNNAALPEARRVAVSKTFYTVISRLFNIEYVGNLNSIVVGKDCIYDGDLDSCKNTIRETLKLDNISDTVLETEMLSYMPISSFFAAKLALDLIQNHMVINIKDENWLRFESAEDHGVHGSAFNGTVSEIFRRVFESDIKTDHISFLVEDEEYYCNWEEYLDNACFEYTPNSSLVASGALQFRNNSVPGSCALGKFGVWFQYPTVYVEDEPEMESLDEESSSANKEPVLRIEIPKLEPEKVPVQVMQDENSNYKEYTQVSGNFFRDNLLSSSNSILVNVTLSLDTPISFPPSLAWEAFNVFPMRAPGKECEPLIPEIYPFPAKLLFTPLENQLESRLSLQCMIFASIAEEGIDFPPLDAPRKPAGMSRHWPIRSNPYGFHQKVEIALLGVDPVLPTISFGVTRTVARPNATGVNTRNIWHSINAITESIARPRNAKDYEYMIKKTTGSGANEPATYSVQNHNGEFACLLSKAFTVYTKEYEGIKERREIFARQLALSNKIEMSEVNLKAREKQMTSMMRDELQRQIEKKLRKSTRSEAGWKKRFMCSQVVEIQGNWEKRRDERTGLLFFHRIEPDVDDDCDSFVSGESADVRARKIAKRAEKSKIPEKYLDTCQWDVPPTWDGDPMRNAGNGAGAGIFPGGITVSGRFNMENSFASGSLASASVGPTPDVNLGIKMGLESRVGNSAFEQPEDTWAPGRDLIPLKQTGGVMPKTYKEVNRGKPAIVGTGKVLIPDDQSVLGEASTGETSAATIDTRNLEHIAEQLVSSDELIRILARRLGLNENQIVAADELQSVFSVDSSLSGFRNDTADRGSVPVPMAPRLDDGQIDQTALVGYAADDSDNDEYWSDEDDEAGDADIDANLAVDLPIDNADIARNRRRENRERMDIDERAARVRKNEIPYLNLGLHGLSSKIGAAADGNAGDGNDEENPVARSYAWRRLPRPDIDKNFFAKFRTQTMGPSVENCNTYNSPVFLLPIHPVDACQYVPEPAVAQVQSIFIPDAKKDMERAIATWQRNIHMEEQLAQNVATDDLLLFGKAKEMTTAEEMIAARDKEDKNLDVDPKELAVQEAIVASKTGNVAALEDALEANIGVDEKDKFGNTLFLLACQQGSKKCAKLLLRRGANINAQNMSGNTALHYCFAYSMTDLGNYLVSKGANDTILNLDGLTCYEGLDADHMIADSLDREGDV